MPRLRFFLLLNNIPLYGYSTFYLSIRQLIQHLGCFHFLAVIYNAAMSIWIQGLCEHMFSVLLGVDPGVGLLSHVAALCLVIGRTARLSPGLLLHSVRGLVPLDPYGHLVLHLLPFCGVGSSVALAFPSWRIMLSTFS